MNHQQRAHNRRQAEDDAVRPLRICPQCNATTFLDHQISPDHWLCEQLYDANGVRTYDGPSARELRE